METAAILGAGKRAGAVIRDNSGRKIRYEISRRPSQLRKLSRSGRYYAKKREHGKSSIRSKAEHIFAIVERKLKFTKTRYRGLKKQIAKLNIVFAIANLILADRPRLTAGFGVQACG